jgi:hypothetical protein
MAGKEIKFLNQSWLEGGRVKGEGEREKIGEAKNRDTLMSTLTHPSTPSIPTFNHSLVYIHVIGPTHCLPTHKKV